MTDEKTDGDDEQLLDPIEKEFTEGIDPTVQANTFINETTPKTMTDQNNEPTTPAGDDKTPAKKQAKTIKGNRETTPTEGNDAKKDYTALWAAGVALLLAVVLIWLRNKKQRELKAAQDAAADGEYINDDQNFPEYK